jgi:hypothetical protein
MLMSIAARSATAEHPLDVMTEDVPLAENMKSNEEEDSQYCTL